MCTSIQLLLVQRKIVNEVQTRLAKLVAELPYGDPYDPKTVVGPLISEKEAIRVEQWIAEAVATAGLLGVHAVMLLILLALFYRRLMVFSLFRILR